MRLKSIILDKILKMILKYISFFRLLKYSLNIFQNSPNCFWLSMLLSYSFKFYIYLKLLEKNK